MAKVYFIGAGPGDPELLTLKGKKIIEQAEVIIYAGSLVNQEIFQFARETAEIHDSAALTREEIVALMEKAVAAGKTVARVHSGDPALYGAIGEQMELLARRGIAYEVIPGVSSLAAAALDLGMRVVVERPVLAYPLVVNSCAGLLQALESLGAEKNTGVRGK